MIEYDPGLQAQLPHPPSHRGLLCLLSNGYLLLTHPFTYLNHPVVLVLSATHLETMFARVHTHLKRLLRMTSTVRGERVHLVRPGNYTILGLDATNQYKTTVEDLGDKIKAHVLLLFCNDLITLSQVVRQSHLLHSRLIDLAIKMAWVGTDAAHRQMSVEEVEDLVVECPLAEPMYRHPDIWTVDGDPKQMVWLTQHRWAVNMDPLMNLLPHSSTHLDGLARHRGV
jgi:uncharacterized Zn-finger protein